MKKYKNIVVYPSKKKSEEFFFFENSRPLESLKKREFDLTKI